MTVALLLVAGLLHAAEPDAACRAAVDEHQRALAALKKDCRADRDCAVLDADWNPCHGLLAARADDVAGARAAAAARQKGHGVCGFVMPPCPAWPGLAVCARGSCRNANRVGSVVLVLRGAGGRRLAGVDVALTSGELALTRTTDAKGRLTLENTFLHAEELVIAPAGHEPLSRPWSALVKEPELGFRPQSPSKASK